MAKYTLKHKHVNSNILLKEVDSFISDEIRDLDVDWLDEDDRNDIVSMFTDWMEEIANKGLITQYKVICDKRNNTTDDEDDGIVHLDIEFVQYNCLNRSRLEYIIYY